MKTRVDVVLREVAADLAEHGFDAEFLNRSAARMKALTVETEDDRFQYLSGYLRFSDYLVAHAPAEVVDILDTPRRAMQAHVDRLYGRSDTPYLSANRIVSELLEGLRGGGDLEEMVARALAALENIAFADDPEDAVIKMWGILRIRALQRACNWLAQDEHEDPVDKALAAIVGQIETAAEQGRLTTAMILKVTEKIQPPAASAQAREIVASMLMLFLGMGLMFRLETAPALEPLRDRIMALLSDDAESPPPETVASRCDAILEGLELMLERDGFSEYAFREAMAAIGEVHTESEEDARAFQAAMLRLYDVSVPHAPAEVAQTMMAGRTALEHQIEAFAANEAALTAEEIRSGCQAVLQELKTDLEAGGLQGSPSIKALGALTALGIRASEDDEEAFRILFGTMKEVQQIILPYAPESGEMAFRESIAAIEVMIEGLDVSDDPAAWAVYEQSANEQVSRLGQAADPQSISAEFAAVPHIRQFVDLLPSFMERLTRLGIDERTKDGAEMKRLRTRLEQILQVMGAAYTEEQFLRHQHGALRRVATELRQFERRHHLIIVRPPFPATPVTVDPNAVFFSGSEAVAGILDQACQILRMGLATQRAVDNPTHGRWQQLRQSGIAVFDYSAYNPSRADPAGAAPRSRAAEANVLGAASPVARVAYENGWAYVTGTPVVIVARQGQAIPFDIDIEPVLLQGDGGDAERLVAAIQAALYGVQRGITGNSLAATVAELRRLHGDHTDPQVQALLASVSDVRDATHVRLALRAVLDRVAVENALLLLPAFPGGYPPDGRPRLFHVTAFREWGKAAQDETRAACQRAGVDYQIGYEHLNPEVMCAIWSDLCEASFVVADITNLNPNAVFELAMAQALGRRTLILTQNIEPHAHLPSIQKVRTHRYNTKRGRADLALLLDRFLAGKE